MQKTIAAFLLGLFGLFCSMVEADELSELKVGSIKDGAETSRAHLALKEPQLTFIGHATVLIDSVEARVLTDPFFADGIFGLKRQVPPSLKVKDLPPIDIVLVSHTHPDHFDKAALLMMSPKPIVVMPWGRGKTLRKKGFRVVNLYPWQTWEYKDIKIKAIPARHNAWHNLGYIIDIKDTKIYFTGDTKLFKDLKQLKCENIDIMLMPYDGTPVIGNIWTIEQAAQAVKIVEPRICVPLHWETFRNWLTGRPTTPPTVFMERVGTMSPHTQCVILKPGETFIFNQMNPD